MVFEYILKQYNIDPTEDLSIDQSIDFGSRQQHFLAGRGISTVEFEPQCNCPAGQKVTAMLSLRWEKSPYMPYQGIFCEKSYLEAHPDTVQAFVNAHCSAVWKRCHRARRRKLPKMIELQFPETDEAVLTAIVRRLCRAGYVEKPT